MLDRLVILLVALLCLAVRAPSQTQVNPMTQVRWPVITGTVDPTPPTWTCTAANYGQPYTNTATGKQFTCAASGWVNVAAAAVPGGANQDAQINMSGAFGADTGVYTYNVSTHTLGVRNATASGAFTGQSVNGTANTDMYSNGGGNNGIANFFAGCGSNCVASVPPNSADTENLGTIFGANAALPTNAFLSDLRGNSSVLYQKNPSNSVNSPCNQGSNFFEPITFNCFASISTGNLDGGIVWGSEWLVSGHGYNSGSTGSSAVNWSTFHDIYLDPLFETRGIKQGLSIFDTDHAAGDSDPVSIYGNFDGGCERGADECDKGFVDYPAENPTYFHGTIASGGATGATLLTTANTSGQNFFTDEGYLLDISKGTYTGTYSSQGTHDGYAVVNYTGAALPVSTAWGTLNTGTTSAANGHYQQYVSQNLTLTLSADSPGAFVVGTNACMVGGGFVEQLPITAVQAASGNQQTITFSTRYGWVSGSMLMQGGMCGQIATNQASSTWRSGSLVVGSFSPTQVLIGSCSPASCNDAAVYNALGLVSAGAVTAFYPGAEIIGTSNGQPNTVELANNTVAWANGDTIENPHPASVSIRGAAIIATQVSNPNGTTGGFGLDVGWNGPNCTTINCTILGINPPAPGHSMTSAICIGCLSSGMGTFTDATVILPASPGVGTFWEDGGPSTGHNLITTSEGNRIISNWDSVNSKGGGLALIATQTNLTVPFVASNTPQHNATAPGMIPISYLYTSQYLSDFETITGDASVDSTGHWTNTGINGASVPTSVTLLGTNSLGQIINAAGTHTSGFIPIFSASGVSNSHCDDGVTTAGTITCTEPISVLVSYPAYTSLTAGSGNIPALAANSAGFAAPVTGGTSWLGKLPATITAGLLHFAAPAVGDGVNESIITSAPVGLGTADVSGVLPVANGGTGAQGAEVLAFSATPTFSTSFGVSRIVLTANVTSFTLGAGADGQAKQLCFAQDATGSHTVAAPANVHGFFTVGSTASKWSCQGFVYDSTDSIWLATGPGVTNE